ENRTLFRTSKRMLSRQHFVQHDPKRPDVNARINFATCDLLGCHVCDGSENYSRSCDTALPGKLRKTEIEDLHLISRGEHEIGRLDIAMHDPCFMRAS